MTADALDPAEIARRAATLSDDHWRLLRKLASDKAIGLAHGSRGARLARELQQVAFAWPARSPWWRITKHGRAAITQREERA